MRTSRPHGAATNCAKSARAVRPRVSSGAIRLLSVTAVAATTCMLWAGAASAATTQPHAKYATTTKITNKNPGSVQVGKKFTFDVTVTSPAGAPAATGTVKVTAPGASGAYDCTATLASGGKGSCSITAPEYGVVKYDATYSGNATHNGSTYTGPYYLEMKNFTTTTAGPATAKAGSVTLTANVYAMGADIDHAAGGTGSVTFYVGTSPTGNPATACPAQLLTSFNSSTHENQATCVDKLAAGTYYLTDKFSGDETNEPSNSKTVKLVVS
jgi:hypothetical protein